MNTEELKKLAMAVGCDTEWERDTSAGLNCDVRHKKSKRRVALCFGLKSYKTKEQYMRDQDWSRKNADFIAAANPTSILALIAEIARFKQDAEMAAASLNLLTGHHEHLLAEFDRVTKQRDKLLAALELFMESVDEPPESNCSCHLYPPCNDCVEYSGLREAFSDAHDAIAKAEG